MRVKRQGWYRTAAVGVAAILLAACGGASDEPAQETEDGDAQDEAEDGDAQESTDDEAASSEYEELAFSIVHDTNVDSTLHNSLTAMQEYIAEESGGNIELTVIPGGGTGGDMEAAIEQLRSGGFEGLVIPTSVFSNLDSQWSLLSLPFLSPSLEVTKAFYDSDVMADMLGDLENQGIVGTSMWIRNFRQLLIADGQVETLADLEGRQIRVPPAPVYVATFEAMNANPVQTAWGEVYTALQLGTVGGLETPTALIESEKFYEVIDSVTFWNYSSDGMILGFNQTWWEGLEPATQDLLREAGAIGAESEFEQGVEAEQSVRALLEEEGVAVIELDTEARDEFVDATESVWADLEEDVGAELIQRAREFVNSQT